MLSAVNLREGHGYAFFAAGSGIALNPTTKQVVVAERWRMKTYRLEESRSWKANKVHTGPTHMAAFGGVAGTTQNVNNMLLAKARVYELSNFTLVVKDVDNPAWRIRMVSEKD